MEWVISKINSEVEEMTNSAVKSVDDFVRREFIAEAAGHHQQGQTEGSSS